MDCDKNNRRFVNMYWSVISVVHRLLMLFIDWYCVCI